MQPDSWCPLRGLTASFTVRRAPCQGVIRADSGCHSLVMSYTIDFLAQYQGRGRWLSHTPMPKSLLFCHVWLEHKWEWNFCDENCLVHTISDNSHAYCETFCMFHIFTLQKIIRYKCELIPSKSN